MNVIVSNKNSGLLNSLDVDVIKSINGEYTVEEISQTFSNFFFNRMFLDITAIKGYEDISNIQKLSISLEMDKVILLLSNELMSNNGYLSKLISMGIYNFANNKESLMYLYNHPNSYKDVAHIHQLDSAPQEEEKTQTKKSGGFFTKDNKPEEPKYNDTIKTAKILGIKNVTSSAGATTLTYMLKKYLSQKNYVVALEVGKNDFGFFNEKDMYSINQNNLSAALRKFDNATMIIVDLNGASEELCDDVIYLMEPSTIKLNKMMLINRDIFDKLYGKKIVLNKSMLDIKDISDFENESRSKIFYSIPPLNDREENEVVLQELLDKLGY